MVLQTIRREIVRFARRMHADGLVAGTAGNISCRIPEEETVAITPSGFPYEEMQPEDVPVIDAHGSVVVGSRMPSTEWRLHLAIYQARPDIGAIIHTHEMYSSVLAVLHRPLPPIVEELVRYVGGQVEVAAYAPAQSLELARNVVAALEGRAAALIANHGNVACGPDLAQAYHVGQIVGRVAKVYILASLVGNPIVLPLAVVEQEQLEFAQRIRDGPADDGRRGRFDGHPDLASVGVAAHIESA